MKSLQQTCNSLDLKINNLRQFKLARQINYLLGLVEINTIHINHKAIRKGCMVEHKGRIYEVTACFARVEKTKKDFHVGQMWVYMNELLIPAENVNKL